MTTTITNSTPALLPASRPHPATPPEPGPAHGPGTLPGLLAYAALGTVFGIVLTKSDVISWFRIQEMFRFQAFHMYGIIGSAIVTAAVSLQLIRRSGVRSLSGEPIVVPPKAMGLGWALVGACPGPLFALLGNGIGVIAVSLLAAVAGTWTYGALRARLPH